MIEASERTKIAQEVLDNHAEKLKSEFSTFEERQDLFIDVFGNDIGSSEDLAGLQNQFADGSLRPEVKFVTDEVLTDSYGNIRDAAFDREHQTILLSEDLDAAGIESSIQQEIGHWWDVLLNENQDTVTEDGKPFDEGTAYAERFSKGAKGDNIFSDVVYQNDSHTIFVNGQETEVEFRPIATWNIQGNTREVRDPITREVIARINTLEQVLDVMENPGIGRGGGIGSIEVMALQEVDANTLIPTLRNIPRINNVVENESLDARDPLHNDAPVNLREITFERNGNRYLMFYNNNLGQGIGNAVILRNPPPREQITPYAFANVRNRPNERGYLAVETPDGIYFSIHAEAGLGGGLNTRNDAELLINEALDRDLGSNRQRFILGDFNRGLAFEDEPTAAFRLAFPPALAQIIRLPNALSFGTRRPESTQTLDYMFTQANLLNSEGVVLNDLPNARTELFPSDHFPVLYDDEIASFEGGNGIVRSSFLTVARPTATQIPRTPPRPFPTVNINEAVEVIDTNGLEIDFSGAGRSTDEQNRISFRAEDIPTGAPRRSVLEPTFGRALFNGYEFRFEGLRTIENVAIDESTNTTGIKPSDIDIRFFTDAINVNLEGLTIPEGTGFDLLVTFGNTFPDAL